MVLIIIHQQWVLDIIPLMKPMLTDVIFLAISYGCSAPVSPLLFCTIACHWCCILLGLQPREILWHSHLVCYCWFDSIIMSSCYNIIVFLLRQESISRHSMHKKWGSLHVDSRVSRQTLQADFNYISPFPDSVQSSIDTLSSKTTWIASAWVAWDVEADKMGNCENCPRMIQCVRVPLTKWMANRKTSTGYGCWG